MFPEAEIKKDFNSRDDFFSRAKTSHTIVRELNTELISNNFYFTNDIYSPHFVMLADGEIYVITSKDETVSIIDVKTARMSGTTRKRLFDALQESSYQDNDLVEKINNLTKDIIFKQQQDQLSKHVYASFVNYDDKNFSTEERREKYRKIKISEKLYNTTKVYRDIFWYYDVATKTIDLTEQGKEYFSHIILQRFLKFNETTNFLGRDWMKYLFPNNNFEGLRSKLKVGKNLELEEIVEFIEYLLHKEEILSGEDKEQMRSRHKRQKMRSHVINILYSMISTEEKYNYIKLKDLSEDFSEAMKASEDSLSKELSIAQDDIYTEGGVKGLTALSIKELRGEDATDLLRGRTWITKEELQDSITKDQTIRKIFSQQLRELKKYYNKKGYELHIEGLEVVNKYKKDKEEIHRNISFEEADISSINTSLKSEFSINGIPEKKKKIRERYRYSVTGLDYDFLDTKTKATIQYVLDQDNTKTGGNGSYADVKLRMLFSLVNITNPEDILQNLSYEHQIVDMDSSNEGGLSDHNIFLGPLKTIQAKLKISSAIDIDIFVDSVSGGIDKTIRELTLLDYYLQNPSQRPSNMPEKFIKKQLLIRNTIPQEILEETGLETGLSYLEIDKDSEKKEQIELAVAKYLLRDQLSKGRLHWFIYDNDTVSGLSDELRSELKSGKNPTLWLSSQDEFINKVLQEKNRKTGIYCLCGGGSNNLVKLINNRSSSGKGYIGFGNPEKKNDLKNQEILFTTINTFGGIVSLGTRIKNDNIIVGKITKDLHTTLVA